MPSDAVDTSARPGASALEEAQRAERQLLGRLRRCEAGAFEVLVRSQQDRMYDFCVRMLGDREEAFDVTQEIFLSAHQHLDGFRADASLSTWLFRIARNHCLNRLKYLQRRGRGRSGDLTEADEVSLMEAAGAPARPDEVLAAQRERARVHQAIAELDEEQRALVVLRDVEGLSYEEIMDITELAEGTVKSRLHRAREKLAVILARLEAGATHRGDSHRAK